MLGCQCVALSSCVLSFDLSPDLDGQYYYYYRLSYTQTHTKLHSVRIACIVSLSREPIRKKEAVMSLLK